MKKPSPIIKADFSSILASSIHDMKNSLGFVINSLDELREEIGDQSDAKRMSHLQYETKRINNNLIQLLALYKRENTGLQANFTIYNIAELLEDCLLQEMPALEARGMQANIQCDPDINWNLDGDLINGVLSNAINNAIRYTNHQLLIEAQLNDQTLHIKIHDDGVGFPTHIIEDQDQSTHGINFEKGSTGLGLYFCGIVAALHNNNGHTGEIRLSNDSIFDGGCFSISLPQN